jgi:hypothetical protein
MTSSSRHDANLTGSRGGTAVHPWSPGSPNAPARSARRTVAAFTSYADAERAVDRLADHGFPVERVAIIGQDLETVEQVTGKLDYPSAAWRGALSGAVPGALLGWIFGLFDWADPVVSAFLLALYGLLIGAVIGAILGLIVYALQGGRRDFVSVTAMRPQRYELVVDDEVAVPAARLIASEV